MSITARALKTDDMKLMAQAVCSDARVMSACPRKMSKTRPISTYSGVPGWCGTPTMWLVVMNSPASQNGVVVFTVAA